MANRNNKTRFCEVIWPHLATVLRTAEFFSHGTPNAEDLAQEVMIKAFKSLDALRDDACAKAWLMTILRRTQIDRVRSADPPEQSLEGMNFDPASPVEAAETDADFAWDRPDEVLEIFSDRRMIDALKELPKEIRWTLLLVDVEGLDQSEAAKVLGIPLGTVKSRIHRGRAMLRAALKPTWQRGHMPVLA